jgi:hypothetical protein
MAVAALIIPGAVLKLAEGVVVDSTNTTTAQTLFTVQNGMKAVILAVVFKDPSVTMAATCAFTTGFSAGIVAATNVTASGVLSVALASGTAQVLQVGNVGTQGAAGTAASAFLPAAAGGPAYGIQAQNYNIKFSATGTTTAVKVDVLGYYDFT